MKLRNDPEYWAAVRARAKELGTDGCTHALQVFVDACYEHDIPYATGRDVCGTPVSKAYTDWRFSARIRQLARSQADWNPLTWRHVVIGYPMSWWRYAAVAGINFNGGWWNQQKAREQMYLGAYRENPEAYASAPETQ